MATQVVKSSEVAVPTPLYRPDDQEYWTIRDGKPIELYWSEMTLTQKRLQIEAEQRQAHIDNFGIYS